MAFISGNTPCSRTSWLSSPGACPAPGLDDLHLPRAKLLRKDHCSYFFDAEAILFSSAYKKVRLLNACRPCSWPQRNGPAALTTCSRLAFDGCGLTSSTLASIRVRRMSTSFPFIGKSSVLSRPGTRFLPEVILVSGDFVSARTL
jgi:hypothetical protein